MRARFADYLGAWGGDQRWGGTGRNALLIVEDIDETGRATGIFAAGPPTATTASKAPANFTTFSGQVTDVGIAFAWGTLHYMFKRLPENLMQGHLEGEIAQRQIVNTIILQRIMPGMKLPTGGPGDVSAAAPPSPPANPQPSRGY